MQDLIFSNPKLLIIFLTGMVVFIVCLLLAFVSVMMSVVNLHKLKNRVKKLDPKIRLNSSVFFIKSPVFNYNTVGVREYWWRIIFSFGSRKDIEEYHDIFIDMKEIKNLKDEKCSIYLDNVIISTQYFARAWVVGVFIMLTIIVISLISNAIINGI